MIADSSVMSLTLLSRFKQGEFEFLSFSTTAVRLSCAVCPAPKEVDVIHGLVMCKRKLKSSPLDYVKR